MNDEPIVPNGIAVDDESANSASDLSDERVKYAAHASWLAPILASLIERRFSSVARDPTAYGFIAAVALVIVVALVAAVGVGLGLYALVRSKNTRGIRKPAGIGTVLSAGFLALFLGGFAIGFSRSNAALEITNSDAGEEAPSASASEGMNLFANEAVASALGDFDIVLDFSPGSIEHVESILARLHDQHAQAPISLDQMTVEALRWGGYVGEVIKTQRNCNWAVESSVGSGRFPIVFEDSSESFPVRWCYERILYGHEYDIRHKFANVLTDGHDAEVSPLAPTSSVP